MECRQHTDSNNTKAHSGGILDSKVTKSSTSTGDGDPVSTKERTELGHDTNEQRQIRGREEGSEGV